MRKPEATAIVLRLALGLLLGAACASAQQLVLTPRGLTFTYTFGSNQVPPRQTLEITSPAGSVDFTFVGLGSGRDFVTLKPLTSSAIIGGYLKGTTPATISVGVDKTGIAEGVGPPNIFGYRPGGYYQYVYVWPGDEETAGLMATVGLNVKLPAPPAVASVINAASGQPGPVAPGEIVSILGTGLGPLIPRSSYSLPDTLVTFDGVYAPLLFVQERQINAVAPFEIAGKASTQLVVTHFGEPSVPLELAVTETSPAVFSVEFTGNGQGAILNQDSTVNNEFNPAAKGSVIQIFGTGAGVLRPPLANGARPYYPPFPEPVATVSASIGGLPAQLFYKGQAPRLIAGALQVNALVPPEVGAGAQPVALKIGENSNSRQQVTVAVLGDTSHTLALSQVEEVLFLHTANSTVPPAARTVQVSSTGGSVEFSAAALIGGAASDCITVSPRSGQTPATLTLAVGLTPAALSTLSVGRQCTGALVVRSPGLASRQVSVALAVVPPTP